TASNAPVNLVSRSRMRNRNWPIPAGEVHDQVAGLLGSRGAVGVLCHSEDVQSLGRDLHDEQHVYALEEDRVHGEEVARQQALCLGAQDPPPGGIQAARSGPAASGAEDPPDGRRADAVAEAGQLAVYPADPQAGFSAAKRSTRSRIS